MDGSAELLRGLCHENDRLLGLELGLWCHEVNRLLGRKVPR